MPAVSTCRRTASPSRPAASTIWRTCCARAIGGQLARDGMVEVVSSLERDGRPVFRDLRWGVYVVFKAPNDYAAACFRQYGLPTDSSGRYAAHVQALPPDRAGTLDLGAQRRALRAADRRDPRLARRRRRGRQARPEGRRDARRRGRLHRLRQARSRPPAASRRTPCRSASPTACRSAATSPPAAS